MLYWWTEILNIPQKPGIYAWYYSPEITDFDLKQAILQLSTCKEANDLDKASEIAKTFLQSNIFRYFQEEPYQAVLRGSLKPRYEGYVEHTPEMSEDLIKRIVEDPERLITLKEVLERSVPYFASPIYIGMSDNLKQRIKNHKKLIEKYYSQTLNSSDAPAIREDKLERDQSFAVRISKLGIPPTRLFVAIDTLDNVGRRYVDIENVLNRIHYPLLGRN